jgi:hypothetical protein
MRTGFLMTGLLLLIIASLMMSYMTVPGGSFEGFMNYAATASEVNGNPIGAFDGVKLVVGPDGRSKDDVHTVGGNFAPGPDNLFIFKNNECKPECCGSSFSCGGGCVCTTPDQRKYINQRGGNRTVPDDGI